VKENKRRNHYKKVKWTEFRDLTQWMNYFQRDEGKVPVIPPTPQVYIETS
jgi:hypothetical protein